MNKLHSWLLAAALLGVATVALAAGIDHTRMTNAGVTIELADTGQWSGKLDIIDDLRDDYGLTRLKPADVLNDTNRRAAGEDFGNISLFDDSGKNSTSIYGAEYSFIWQSDDYNTTSWFPQGISGSGDANSAGTVDGKRALVVSWYAKKNQHKGARISFVNVTNLGDVRYRHVLLVEPYRSGGNANFRAVDTHAGGIVWYKNYLYVADTYDGVRVFHLNRIMRAQADSTKSKIGIVGGQAYAFDYRYILPQVGYYSASDGFRYSFVGLDRTTSPHSLLAGEYQTDSSGRVARFSLNQSNGKLATSGGVAESTAALNIRRTRTQGMVSAYGHYFYNHTYSSDQYRFHIQKPSSMNPNYVSLRGGYGLEDLYYDNSTHRLWLHTEHDGGRKVFYRADPIGEF